MDQNNSTIEQKEQRLEKQEEQKGQKEGKETNAEQRRLEENQKE